MSGNDLAKPQLDFELIIVETLLPVPFGLGRVPKVYCDPITGQNESTLG